MTDNYLQQYQNDYGQEQEVDYDKIYNQYLGNSA